MRQVYLFSLLLISCAFISCSSGENKRELSLSQDWSFKAANAIDASPIRIPSTVYQALSQRRNLPPLLPQFTDSLAWIAQKSWVYSCAFFLEEDWLEKQQVYLQLSGIEGLAELKLNGHALGQADNPFRTWEYDVKSLLQEGENILSLTFQALPLAQKDSLSPMLPQIRKAAYTYNLAGQPQYFSTGLSNRVQLIAWDKAIIRGVYFKPQRIQADSASYELQMEIQADKAIAVSAQVLLNDQSFDYTLKLRPGIQRITLPVGIGSPKYWWPNGMGAPHLYQAYIRLMKGKKELDAHLTQLGVRSLAWEKDSTGAQSLNINGQPVLLRGATFSPLDIQQILIDAKRYQRSVRLAAQAGLNLLKVPSYSVYESEAFYDACDRKGILVWQELPLPDSLPLAAEAFKVQLKPEINQQLTRLRTHPAFALLSMAPQTPPALAAYVQTLLHPITMDALQVPSATHEAINKISLPQALPMLPGKPDSLAAQLLWPLLQLPRAPRTRFTPEALYLQALNKAYGPARDMQTSIYFSQLQQVQALETALVNPRGTPDILFDQWQATWPMMGSAFIDQLGTPQPAYYSLKHRSQPIQIRPSLANRKVWVRLSSSQQEPVQGQLHLAVKNFNGKTTWQDTVQVSLTPNSQAIVFSENEYTLLRYTERRIRYLHSTLISNGRKIAEHVFYFEPDRLLLLPAPSIQSVVSASRAGNRFSILLSSDKLARSVWLRTRRSKGVFSDNGFDLLPGQRKKIFFDAGAKRIEDFAGELEVWSYGGR